MLKMMYAMRRKPGLSREEFLSYWREHHAPLVVEASGKRLKMVRYVQSHTASTPVESVMQGARNTQIPEYDGVAECWYEDVDALVDAWQAPASQDAARQLLEDEYNFVDVPNSPLWIAQEHVIIGD